MTLRGDGEKCRIAGGSGSDESVIYRLVDGPVREVGVGVSNPSRLAGSAGLRLGLALEIERHCGADEIP